MAPSEPPGRDLALLRLLQLADSGFPSGAFTLSHGLETLAAEGAARNRDELAELILVQLLAKAARSDLVALLAAHDAAGDSAEPTDPDAGGPDRIAAIDRRLTASKIAAEDRLGSVRVGRRLAAEVARIAPTPALSAFLAAIEKGRTPGNVAIAFGLAASALGIPRRDAALAAASGLAASLAAAAVRLGLIGHGDAQRLIAEAAPIAVAAVDLAEAGDWRDPRPSAPQLEIALARHEAAPARLFAT